MFARCLSVCRFFVAVWGRVGAGHFGLIAAGVAFYAMFAVFPGLAASVAIWSLMADPGVIASYLSVAEDFLPVDAATLVHDQVMGLLVTPRSLPSRPTPARSYGFDRALFGPRGRFRADQRA